MTALDSGATRRYEALGALARQAGALVLDRFGRAEIEFKDDDSMVTEADGAAQAWLARHIAAMFPGDAVIGEEGFRSGDRPEARYVWVVDPIDGTNNYGRGMPGFSVSMGVLRDGVPVGGAVYDPLATQLYTAWVGQGAWLNGRRLRTPAASLDRRSLFTIRTPFVDGVPAPVTHWLERYRLRRVGSTALQLCYVALGGLAFMYDHGPSLWDIAGAAPIVTEAGAMLTSPEGRPLFPVSAEVWAGASLAILAGAPGAHEAARHDLASTVTAAG
jgi:myo-inositol-1(or 4)-monophosphatase